MSKLLQASRLSTLGQDLGTGLRWSLLQRPKQTKQGSTADRLYLRCQGQGSRVMNSTLSSVTWLQGRLYLTVLLRIAPPSSQRSARTSIPTIVRRELTAQQ